MSAWLAISMMAALLAIVCALLWWLWPLPLARVFLSLNRRQGRLRSRRVQHGDIDWHYLEGGCGEPLVLLHGFSADAYHFCAVSRPLAAHFRILAPDLPGFGETRLDDGVSFRIEDQAEHVLSWLDRLGVHRFYLGGNSMGGYLAVAMARRAPDRVRGLWLMAPGGLHSAQLSAVLQEVSEDRHNPLVVRDPADFQRLVDFCFVRPPWIPRPLARHLGGRLAQSAVQAQRLFDALRFDSAPLEDLARDLPTPSLIIWGQQDQVLHPQGARVLEALLPNSRVLILPGVGHLPMLEAPRPVAEAWLSFTESQARAGGAGPD